MTATRISAHRGGPEEQFEPNSLDAIHAAADLGVDLIEFDVRAGEDGGFVVCHDATLPISGAPLDDVLAAIAGKAMAHVDLKDVGGEVAIADACEAALGADGFVLTTLEDESVARLRAARPHLQVALSLGRDTTGLGPLAAARVRLSELRPGRRVRRCRPTMLALNHRIAAAGVAGWARRHDLPVLLWTLNTPDLLAAALADGRYWAVTTDYPRLALRLRAEQAGG